MKLDPSKYEDKRDELMKYVYGEDNFLQDEDFKYIYKQ
jgi:hypothetical protein